MGIDRRAVCAGLAALSLPTALWGGGVRHVSAIRDGDGYALVGLNPSGAVAWRTPLPARGHGAAVRPGAPELALVGRRHGDYALVVDPRDGRVITMITARPDRRFFGHGVYSADGARLFITENDFDAARGVIGVSAADQGYRRIAEVSSGGIGPHEIVRLNDQLYVANGGLVTHPDTGRIKLNLDDMAPNLARLSASTGDIHAVADAEDRRLGVRHLVVRRDGVAIVAMQSEGADRDAPLCALIGEDGRFRPVAAPDGLWRRMQGYAGSIALSVDQKTAVVTSPRGGLYAVIDLASERVVATGETPDVCGVAAAGDGFLLSSGHGGLRALGGAGGEKPLLAAAFDNHLSAV